jgi:hypothetical protein
MDDVTKLVDSFSHIAWWLLVVALLVWLRFSRTGSTARSSIADFVRNRDLSAEVLGAKLSAQVVHLDAALLEKVGALREGLQVLDAAVLERVGALDERLDALAAAIHAPGEETNTTDSVAVTRDAWRALEAVAASRPQMVEEILLLADWDQVQSNEWRPWARSDVRVGANDQYEGFLSMVKTRAAAGPIDRLLVVLPEYIMPMTAQSPDERVTGLRALRDIREISPMPPTVIYAPGVADVEMLDEVARRFDGIGAASSLNGIDNLLRPRGLTIIGPELAHGR